LKQAGDMALLGHHFFDVTSRPWALRLQNLWGGAGLSQDVCFKRLAPSPTNVEACALATSYYAGETAMTADEFLSLTWLDAFARSGRQLLLCHALNLLQGWATQSRRKSSLQHDLDILYHLSKAAPDFAFHLNPVLLGPLAAAMRRQINCVLASRPKSFSDYLYKAQILQQTADVVQNGFIYTEEAIKLWDLAVPHLVAADGGPTQDTLHTFVTWITPLLAASDLTFATATRNALDRAAPFLSTVVRADGRYSFAPDLVPVEAVREALPMRHARHASVAQLGVGKTIAIALPQHLNSTSLISISSHGLHLCDASFAAVEQTDPATLDVHQTEQGQLLQLTESHCQRTLFLSPQGDDLRIEEIVKAAGTHLILKLNASAKISVGRCATQASFAMGNKNLWQLSLRGGTIEPTENDNILHVVFKELRLNWSLKRIARATTKPVKSTNPELPFELEFSTRTH
jgi:hypothetical protein